MFWDCIPTLKGGVFNGINARNLQSFISATNTSNHTEERSILKKYNLKAKDVRDAFCKVHPIIKEKLHSNASYELMQKDSDIIQEVLMRLKNKGILGLPLHDSILCQEGNEDKVKNIMQDVYKEYTGFEIGVDFK